MSVKTVKELATEYQLDAEKLMRLLHEAGLAIEDESTVLNAEAIAQFKNHMMGPKKRLSKLSVGSGPKDQKIKVLKANPSNQSELRGTSTQVISSQKSQAETAKASSNRPSDADAARALLSVRPQVKTEPPVTDPKVLNDQKPKSSAVEKASSTPSKTSSNAQPKHKKSLNRQERQEREGDLKAAAELSLLQSKQKFNRPTQKVVCDVAIPESITVADLANQCSVKASEVIAHLFQLGVMATINQSLDQETAVYVAEALGHRVTLVKDNETLLSEALVNPNPPEPRAPIVTVMGHVDHGKTSLLDAIRRSQIVDTESGGITQHIGAYFVETSGGAVTFLDTPGHEAFTAMRARGAECTDIIVLVVAADDGVMPQTIEAIQHAKAAEVPLVVAVNKIDKEGADPERIKTELIQHDVLAESLGGDVLFQEISAKKGQGVSDLLDNLALQAEILELKAPIEGSAAGLVIESVLDKGLGPLVTLLVQSGTLKQGDIVLSGQEYGRVRTMIDSHGQSVDSAGPSVPVKVTGLSGVPAAGDVFRVVESERVARMHANQYQTKLREKKAAQSKPKSLDQMFLDAQAGETITQLSVVIKADTHGSVEAISEAVKGLASNEVDVRVMGAGVGQITESDVNLAEASNAILVGFNVRANTQAIQLMRSAKMTPFYCSVIYDLIDHINVAISGLKQPTYTEKIIGLAEVREVFRSSKYGLVSGCMVLEGALQRNADVRVLRDGIVIHQGALNSLRRGKDNVSEVKTGVECGLGIKDYKDIKSGDRVEAFTREMI